MKNNDVGVVIGGKDTGVVMLMCGKGVVRCTCITYVQVHYIDVRGGRGRTGG